MVGSQAAHRPHVLLPPTQPPTPPTEDTRQQHHQQQQQQQQQQQPDTAAKAAAAAFASGQLSRIEELQAAHPYADLRQERAHFQALAHRARRAH